MNENDKHFSRPKSSRKTQDLQPDPDLILTSMLIAVATWPGVPVRVLIQWTDPDDDVTKYGKDFGLDQLQAAVDFCVARKKEHRNIFFTVTTAGDGVPRPRSH